jgi:hypothetical protein
MIKTAVALTLAALLAGSAAAAGSSAYRGKTKSGSSISFAVAGSTISQVVSGVPTTCLETTGSYASRSGLELYEPPGAFRLGTTGKTKALQPAAMNQGIKATKNYTFSSTTSGGKIRGTLKVSFSFLRPGADIYHSLIYICSGVTTFVASAR